MTIKLHYPPKYVLDEMQWYEITSALRYSHYAVQDTWEQARLIAYTIAQCNSTKRLKLEDIVKFGWDGDQEHEVHDTKITKEDIERLSKKAQDLIDKNIL